MADKLNTFTSNLIKFVAGERPSADKFNAANEFFSRNIRDISRAIGDMYGVGYPHLSDLSKDTHLTGKWNPHEIGNRSGRPLDISSLSRIIGPASNLNPKMVQGAKVIQEIIPSGVAEYQLKFKSVIFDSLLVGSITGFSQINPSENFTSGNQFKIIKNSIIFNSPLSSDVTVTYSTNPNLYFGGPNYLNATFNVIPDPNQETKLTISEQEDGSYLIDLNEIKITNQQSGLVDLTLSSTNAEPNANQTMTLPYWMWSTEDGEPLFEEGTVIPEGLLYVKDLTSNECFLTATYTFVSKTELKISGVSLCLDDEYQIVVTGTDITTSIDDLRNKWFLHKHDGTFGEQRISVKDLVGKFISGEFEESSLPDNDFPMYLHRKGYLIDSSLKNGNNAMLGPLVMASENFDSITNTVEVMQNNSHAIIFGNQRNQIKDEEGWLSISSNETRGFSGIKIESNDGYINANSENIGLVANNNLRTNFKEKRNSAITGEIYDIRTSTDFLNEGNFVVEEIVTNESLTRNKEILIEDKIDTIKGKNFSTYIIEPSNKINPFQGYILGQDVIEKTGEIRALSKEILINGVEADVYVDPVWQYKLLNIPKIEDNFIINFKKLKEYSSIDPNHGILNNDGSTVNISKAVIGYSVINDNNTINAQILSGTEDVDTGILGGTDGQIPFNFISYRSFIKKINGEYFRVLSNFDLQFANTSNPDTDNLSLENETGLTVMHSEMGEIVKVNDWFLTHDTPGDDNPGKEALWINFKNINNEVSFKMMVNFLNGNATFENVNNSEGNHKAEIYATTRFFVERDGVFKILEKDKYSFESGNPGYDDNFFGIVWPDGELLTRIKFNDLSSKDFLLDENEFNSPASAEELYNVLQSNNVNIYLSRGAEEERSNIGVFSIRTVGQESYRYYYDFLSLPDKSSQSDFPPPNLNSNEHKRYLRKLDGNNLGIDFSFIASNRFFIKTTRDISFRNLETKIQEREFYISTYDNVSKANNCSSMTLVIEDGQVHLLESPQFILHYLDSDESNVEWNEEDLLNTYIYGHSLEEKHKDKKIFNVKINGKEIIETSSRFISLTQCVFKYIKNKVNTEFLADDFFGEPTLGIIDGFLKGDFLLKVKEKIYFNERVDIDIELSHNIKRINAKEEISTPILREI